MSDFANNIRKLRLSKKLTLEQLADNINQKFDTKYSKGTVSRWESGTEPTMDSVRNIATYFGVTIADLLGIKDYPTESVLDDYIAVIGTISAGIPLFAEENIIGYTARPPLINSKNKRLFYLRVKGDSMDKEFPDGSDVLVDREANVNNGDIAVVLINGDEATVKKVKFEDHRIILIPMSYNDEHYAQSVDLTSTEVTVIGKVIGAFKRY